MPLKTSLKYASSVLPTGLQKYLRELYYDEVGRRKVRRLMANCFPWYFHKECPFCGLKFHRFEDGGIAEPVLTATHCVGGGYRTNMACPGCHSTDRERLIYLYLKLKTNLLSQRLTILHIAPEGQLERILRAQPLLKYLTADICSPLVMTRIDLSNAGIHSNVFDVIICNHVLEHILNDDKAMLELLRMLKPGGWALLQVPLSPSLLDTVEDPTVTDPKERLRQYGQEDHVRIYAAHDYRLRLERAGFVLRRWNACEEYGDTFVRRFSLIKEEDLYVWRRPISADTSSVVG